MLSGDWCGVIRSRTVAGCVNELQIVPGVPVAERSGHWYVDHLFLGKAVPVHQPGVQLVWNAGLTQKEP